MTTQNPLVGVRSGVEQHAAYEVRRGRVKVLRHLGQLLDDCVAEFRTLKHRRLMQHLQRCEPSITVHNSVAVALFGLLYDIKRVTRIETMLSDATHHGFKVLRIEPDYGL